MKIQINNLEALERLIGGDTELEIEVRNSVVQDFAKKHLKCIAESPQIMVAVDAAKRAAIEESKKAIEANLGKFSNSGWNSSFSLNDKIKTEMKFSAERAVGLLVEEKIMDAVKYYIESNSGKYIEKRIEQGINAEIDRRVKEKLQELYKKV
jgi:hypothetical protein